MGRELKSLIAKQQVLVETLGKSGLQDWITAARACEFCKEDLPFAPKPVLRARETAKILIVGQAPGTKVQASGIPWDDPSGEKLREWMQLKPEQFYNESEIAILPMGLCYPGKGKSGDLPPRKECAELWHQPISSRLKQVELVLLIGQYAQNQYYPDDKLNLTKRVKSQCDQGFDLKDGRLFVCLPHPSPRNRIWLKKNEWFETEIIPMLRQQIKHVLKQN